MSAQTDEDDSDTVRIDSGVTSIFVILYHDSYYPEDTKISQASYLSESDAEKAIEEECARWEKQNHHANPHNYSIKETTLYYKKG